MQSRKSECGICHEVRSTVYIYPVIAATEIRIADFGEAGVKGNMTRQGNGCLCLVAVGTRRPFELEATVVGDIDLLVGVVD